MSSTASSPFLRPLLSACYSASVLGGRVIRDVVQQHIALDLVNKQAGGYDPQTIADRRSQQRMVSALRHAFPLVTIVGEEGELALPAPEDVVQCDLHVLDHVIRDETPNPVLDWNELVLWIDPLDGTKRFAAKKYDEVSVLIGISYQQRPIAGVMHLPFHGPHGVTYWGGPRLGVFRSEHAACETQTIHTTVSKPPCLYPTRQLVCIVSSTECELIDKALVRLKPSTIQTGGATGTMVLRVLRGECDAFFRFKAATRKWDICAMEPLLEALGGRLTDRHGNVYVYDPIGNAPDFDNEHGLVACLDAQVHEMIVNTVTEVTAEASIMSALDGRTMTPQWFQECVFPTRQVSAVELAPGSIHQGKHSSVAKLHVQFEDDDRSMITVFLKKSVKNDLAPRSAENWKCDIASYCTESNFYAHFASFLQAHGVRLIRPLAVFQSNAFGHCTSNLVATDTNVETSISDPENFLMLLECFDAVEAIASTPLGRYEAADCLELVDTQQALTYLVHLHASTWGPQGQRECAKARVTSAPCWWTYPKRGDKELAQALEIWPRMLRSWEAIFKAQSCLPPRAELESLGARMVHQAAYISACLSTATTTQLSTFVHGDYKSSNLAFEAPSRAVVAFDWQWSGVGLGVLDVANLLNTSVSMLHVESDAHELALLRFYYDKLDVALQERGMHLQAMYPFEAMERHYMLATLEYARVLISKFWNHMTPETCEAKAHQTNCGLGYRSVPHVVRMVRKLHQGLERVKLERQDVA